MGKRICLPIFSISIKTLASSFNRNVDDIKFNEIVSEEICLWFPQTKQFLKFPFDFFLKIAMGPGAPLREAWK